MKNNHTRLILEFQVILLIIAAIFSARYYYLKYKIYDYGAFAKKIKDFSSNNYPSVSLTQEQIFSIGDESVQDTPPRSSYRYFTFVKKPGVIRIGIFGCSMVTGDETAPGDDIASFLEQRFKQAGINNVEVLNFGLTARGVHQMYLMWQFCAKKYEIDRSVFFPFYWHRFRDSSFRWADLFYPPIYARYILRNSSLSLIFPDGKDAAEIYNKYFRLIPAWRYLRYDSKMPLFLKTLLPIRLHNKLNPFYYRFSLLGNPINKEIMQTYKIIFSRIQKESPSVLIIANDDYIAGLADKGLKIIKSKVPELISSFLYTAPLGHTSALGNQLRAEELFWRLSGKIEYDLFTWEIAGYVDVPARKELPALPLQEYRDMALYAGNQRAASFITYQPKNRFGIIYRDFKPQESNGYSLLLIPDSREEQKNFAPALEIKTKPITARFCLLDFPLDDNDTVKLSLLTTKGVAKVAVGMIRAPSPNFGRVELFPEFEASDSFSLATSKPQNLIIGKHKILLRRVEFVYLRAKEGDFIDIFDNRQTLTLDIKAITKNGLEYRIPLFSLVKDRSK